jgi:mRNA-degrading endonuclease YafQ of YafQ-DinJ toxin-antitoxin module
MIFEVKLEKAFVKRMDNLATLFRLNVTETKEVRETIIYAVELLAQGKQLPENYLDHELQREP